MRGIFALAIPLPPDFELHGRKCMGFLPCLRGCGEFMPVFAGKRKFYASCSPQFVTVRHCKAEYGQPDLSDFPAQNRENAEHALAENPEIPGEYLEIIKQAWGIENVSRQIPEFAENRDDEPGNDGTDEPGYSGNVEPTDTEIVATTNGDATGNERDRPGPDPFEGLY